MGLLVACCSETGSLACPAPLRQARTHCSLPQGTSLSSWESGVPDVVCVWQQPHVLSRAFLSLSFTPRRPQCVAGGMGALAVPGTHRLWPYADPPQMWPGD